MSEPIYDGEPMEYEEGEGEMPYEVDPGHVAFLDQQSAQFEGEREQFKELYGFDHECTCGMDYTQGRVGMVTECFVKLSTQALDRSAQATALVNVLGPALENMLMVNEDLMGLLKKHGHDDELQAYLNSKVEGDEKEADENTSDSADEAEQ